MLISIASSQTPANVGYLLNILRLSGYKVLFKIPPKLDNRIAVYETIGSVK